MGQYCMLREIHTGKGLSQEQAVERMDVARNYISYLENGPRYPPLEMLIAVAQVLGLRQMVDKIAARVDGGRASPLPGKQAGLKT